MFRAGETYNSQYESDFYVYDDSITFFVAPPESGHRLIGIGDVGDDGRIMTLVVGQGREARWQEISAANGQVLDEDTVAFESFRWREWSMSGGDAPLGADSWILTGRRDKSTG